VLRPGELQAEACRSTGLSDFGGESHVEGLERLTRALADEGDLTDGGEGILRLRLGMLLANRLRIEETYRVHPEIADEEVEGPLFIIGLPRTGTTATSQLVAADPRVRSLRLWESIEPVSPPESATEHTDPRIDSTAAGLDAMYVAFPRMRTLYFQTANGATECQDLLGMSFRAAHFDGMAHVPTYTDWVVDCDMGPAYDYHRRVLRLLQWHCPPRLWHLKTPVHMFSLGALVDAYPGARFLWTHRDPADVLGSVCSLIAYTRSWVSDRGDAGELGAQQLGLWAEAVRRAMTFRDEVGEDRFGDVSWAELQVDPVGALGRAYASLGMSLAGRELAGVAAWAAANPAGGHGTHEFSLSEFSLEPPAVRGRFADYLDRFAAEVAGSVR